MAPVKMDIKNKLIRSLVMLETLSHKYYCEITQKYPPPHRCHDSFLYEKMFTSRYLSLFPYYGSCAYNGVTVGNRALFTVVRENVEILASPSKVDEGH